MLLRQYPEFSVVIAPIAPIHPQVKVKMTHGGGLDILLAAMETHRHVARLQEYACGAISNIATSEACKRHLSANLRVESLLRRAAVDHPDCRPVTDSCSRALDLLRR